MEIDTEMTVRCLTEFAVLVIFDPQFCTDFPGALRTVLKELEQVRVKGAENSSCFHYLFGLSPFLAQMCFFLTRNGCGCGVIVFESKDLAQRIPPGHAQILTRDLALALSERRIWAS